MKNRTKIAIGLGAVTTGALIFTAIERSKNNMFMDQYENFEEVSGVCENTEPVKELLPVEVEKINGMVQGMSEQELRVVLRNIPVGLMFDEIGARLAMHEQFAQNIQDALKSLPR